MFFKHPLHNDRSRGLLVAQTKGFSNKIGIRISLAGLRQAIVERWSLFKDNTGLTVPVLAFKHIASLVSWCPNIQEGVGINIKIFHCRRLLSMYVIHRYNRTKHYNIKDGRLLALLRPLNVLMGRLIRGWRNHYGKSNNAIFLPSLSNSFKPYFLLLISSYFEIGLYSDNIPSIKFDVPSKIWIFDGPSHPHSEVLGNERTVFLG
jgi:hypothetical protein